MPGLEDLLTAAFGASSFDPLLQRSTHADFQANGALPLARRLHRPAREVAAEVLAAARLDGLATGVVSGPGFINLTLLPEAVDRLLADMAADERLGVPVTGDPQRVIVDYSGPNVAKEMHVGHLRSTIIGDCLVRVLRFAGHDVRGISHTGDWGTPFGMLLERLVEIGEAAAAHELSVGDLDGFYKAARVRFDEDPAFAERARRRVVLLQGGDPESLRLWRILVAESRRYFMAVNERLGVLLTEADYIGESFYNDRLDGVVRELAARGLLRMSEGAECVFPQGFTGRDGAPFPVIVRKRDGGFNYSATDLAAIRYRIKELKSTLLLYVTGAPQSRHLEMVFGVAREAGWLTRSPVRVRHVAFGSILGDDGRMLRSRAGRSVKLIELLDEAVARAGALIADREMEAWERERIARAVGIGAVKYADLSTDMVKDYVFDLDRMLAFTGDTAGYLQYTHARAHSVLRKAGGDGPGQMHVTEPAERALALELLAFPDAVLAVAEQLQPHRLAGYLRGLAVAFTAFWDGCPVLRAEPPVRASRLALCDLTARVLKLGLDLLGIEAPQRM